MHGAELFERRVPGFAGNVATDFAAESATMLVAFGGIAGGLSMPVFEFFRLAASLPIQKMFLRDPTFGWYQRGVPGLAANVDELTASLAARIARQGVARVVTVGVSAGGYAALLFGARLGVAEVHAFSPQTFIDRENRLWHGDHRWPEQIDAMHRDVEGDRPSLDLRRVLLDRPAGTRFHVHFSHDDLLDERHARHVADLPGVVLHGYHGGGHKLAKWLRETGALGAILRASLDAAGGTDFTGAEGAGSIAGGRWRDEGTRDPAVPAFPLAAGAPLEGISPGG